MRGLTRLCHGRPHPKGRNTNQNWRPPGKRDPDLATLKREKEQFHGPVSASLFFKRPDIAAECYPDMKQARAGGGGGG
jgi:hypothetical protein